MEIDRFSRTIVLLALLASGEVFSHTLFVKPDTFIAQPESEFIVRLIDGTFVTSESRLTNSSIRSADIFGPNDSIDLSRQNLLYSGKDTLLKIDLAGPGTYLIAVATRPRKVVLDAESFNFYLRYEGLLDQQQERAELNESGIAVIERYSKFAKALIQVGDVESSNFSREIGHDVEIVPLVNPYLLSVGDTFRARILRNGDPLSGELVYATHQGHYSADDEGIFDEAVKVRSDESGIVEFQITDSGKWYVRFIDLERLGDSEYWYSSILVALGAQEQQISYESKWATLTFEIVEEIVTEDLAEK